jgi:diacylglycerol kinase family enzyme
VRRQLPPRTSGEGVVFVVNPRAGAVHSSTPTETLRAALPAARVVEVEDTALLDRVLRDASEDAEVLGVAGGDGSVSAAAAIAAGAGMPMVVVPTGTLNHFARDVGVATVDDVIAAVGEGTVIGVDRGLVGDTTFLNAASLGAYVDLVDIRERLETRIGKWPAAVVAFVRVLRRSPPIAIELNGDRLLVWTVFIGNCRYLPSGSAPRSRARLDDGCFDVRFVDASRRWARTRLLLAVLTGRLGHSRAYQERTLRELRIRAPNGPLRWALDGETVDVPDDVTVTKSDETLLVYVPPR